MVFVVAQVALTIIVVKEEDNMDNFMRGILSRVLTEEIENQKIWWEQERKNGLPDKLTNRKDNIERIEKFMSENDIPKYIKC